MFRVRHRANDPSQYQDFLGKDGFVGLEVDVRYSQIKDCLYAVHDAEMLLRHNIDQHTPLQVALKCAIIAKRQSTINTERPLVVVVDVKENALVSRIKGVIDSLSEFNVEYYIMGIPGMEYPDYLETFRNCPHTTLIYRISEHEIPDQCHVWRNEARLLDSFHNDPISLSRQDRLSMFRETFNTEQTGFGRDSKLFIIGPDCHGETKYSGRSQDLLNGSSVTDAYIITKEPR